jgi:hypothetical protein
MIRLPLIAALAFAAAAAPAYAQEAQCFQNETALVITRERTDDVGMDILVRAPARGKIKCEYRERAGDWIIGEPAEPLWYEGLAGNYLVLSRSTGPDGDIVIYDLVDRSVLLDAPEDMSITIADDSVTFWQRTVPANEGNCPELAEYTANGLGAIIAEEQVLDVASGTIKATGQSRCSATQ